MQLAATRIRQVTCPKCHLTFDPVDAKVLAATPCPRCKAAVFVPAEFDIYHIRRVIEQGTTGTVCEALDTVLHRPVALKVLSSDGADAEKVALECVREARTLARLNHPAIVQVYTLGQFKGQHFIVMELITGGSAKRFLDEGNRLSEAEAIDFAVTVAEGMQQADAAGLVHMDIKPGNILIDRDGKPKVIDFGAAQFRHRGSEVGVVGTPYYIAPEVARGQSPDRQADMYSFGATLYHLLTLRPPFDAPEPRQVIARRLREPAPPVKHRAPWLSPTTARIVDRLLQADPAARYPDWESLIEALRAARQGAGDHVPTGAGASLDHADHTEMRLLEAAQQTTGRGATRRTATLTTSGASDRTGLIAAGVVGAIFAALVLAFLLFSGGDEEPAATLTPLDGGLGKPRQTTPEAEAEASPTGGVAQVPSTDPPEPTPPSIAPPPITSPAPVAARPVPPDGLLAHLTMDAGELVDAVGGETRYIGDRRVEPGKINDASAFNRAGNGDHALVTLPKVTTNRLSLAAWVKIEEAVGESQIISTGGGAAILIRPAGDNAAIFARYPDDPDRRGIDTGLVVPRGAWCFVACAVEPTRASLFAWSPALGLRRFDYNRPSAPIEMTTLTVGGDPSGEGLWFRGLIDEARVYARTLSETELRELIGEPDPPAPPTPDPSQPPAPTPAAKSGFAVLMPRSAKTSHARAELQILPDGSVLAAGEPLAGQAYTIEFETDRRPITSLIIEVLGHESLPRGGPGRSGAIFALQDVRVFVSPRTPPGDADAKPAESRVAIAHAVADEEKIRYEAAKLVDSSALTGWAVDGRPGERYTLRLDPAAPIDFPGGAVLRIEIVNKINVGRVRVQATTAAPPPGLESIVQLDWAEPVADRANDAPGVPLNLLVNLGGPQSTDAQGRAWSAGEPFRDGGAGYVGGSAVSFAGIEDPRAATAIEGLTNFRATVPNGTYRVTAYFVENWVTRSGERIFDVIVQGKIAWRRLDVCAVAGRYRPYAVHVPRVKVDDGVLDIQLTPVGSPLQPILNAVQIERIGP